MPLRALAQIRMTHPGKYGADPCYSPRVQPPATSKPRHALYVRVTHWLTAFACFTLILTGANILLSHPRFYWGDAGTVMDRPLFTLPLPSSRETVPTTYHYVLPDQNGWSRYAHFQAAWLLVFVAAIYGIGILATGHLRRHLLPPPGTPWWRAIRDQLGLYLRRPTASTSDTSAYNILQQIAYLSVIFLLTPLVLWTGLAMSPSFTSALPLTVTLLGGRQTARTLHFFVSDAIILFVIAHIVMVSISGFRARMIAMTIGDEPSAIQPISVSAPTGELS